MICKFCVGKNIELVRIPIGILSTTDFDNDGKSFLFCPVCFNCDNVNLREQRRIRQSILQHTSLISNRHYRNVIHQLSFRFNSFSDDQERRTFVAETCKAIKLKKDDEKVEFIASAFNVTAFRVTLMVVTVLRLRNYKTEYYERKRRQNWQVIPAGD